MYSIWPLQQIAITASTCKDCEVLRTFKQTQIFRLRRQAWGEEKSKVYFISGSTTIYLDTCQQNYKIDNYEDSYEKMFKNEMKGMADRRGRSMTPFVQ
eukprot:Pgem_evm1s7005